MMRKTKFEIVEQQQFNVPIIMGRILELREEYEELQEDWKNNLKLLSSMPNSKISRLEDIERIFWELKIEL